MTTHGFDARRFKAIERSGFNRIAARYAQGAAMRSALADALIAAAGLAPGQRVLDLASGPGLLAREVARRVQPEGWVLASDIAEGMLAEGRGRAQDELPPAICARLSYAAADGEQLCLCDASVDRVLAGLALFMFPHPERALRECHRVLRPGGRIALSVWGARATVPLISHAQDCITRLLPQPRVARPSVFRFGDPGALETALSAAGFARIHVAPVRWTSHFVDADAYWQAFLDLAGGAAESLAQLPAATQAQLRTAIAHDLQAHHDPQHGGYSMTSQALVATARV
ncbi:MAG: methyltransferase domain-containing protein [Rhodocyclales bacterium]|nr:methyltransferase domain-containing protein [Rhodocyclales bacterium]